jgi:hypothetical protein
LLGDFLCEALSVFVQFHEVAFGGDGSQGESQFVFQQLTQGIIVSRASAQTLSGFQNALFVGRHSHIKVRPDIHAEFVAGDQGISVGFDDPQFRGRQRNPSDVVPPRQNEGAATDDDLRLAPARSDEGFVRSGSHKVKAGKNPPDKVNGCHDDNKHQQHGSDATHASSLLLRLRVQVCKRASV